MKLFIVESPGKVKKIQGFLGPSWKVVASVGHVRDLPERTIGVEPPDFVPCYEATERGAKVLKDLAYKVKNAEAVYLATDPDREGEANCLAPLAPLEFVGTCYQKGQRIAHCSCIAQAASVRWQGAIAIGAG